MTSEPVREAETTRLFVYWCPRCEVQAERPWHLCKRGPGLIPQLDEETTCERIEVVPGATVERNGS